jgi:hypothetical protein
MRRVHRSEAYDSLCEGWSRFYDMPIPEDGFFPPYRLVPADADPNPADG